LKVTPCKNPLVFWLTGLSGSGKSTIAAALEQRLSDFGILSQWVDGDTLREGLCKDLGFSLEDRKENIRRVAELAKILNLAGVTPIVSLISPMAYDREMAKNIIGASKFLEIYVSTPIEICEQRDPKGLYQKAKKGIIKDFTGLSSPYEQPITPTFNIDTSNTTIDVIVEKIVAFSLPIMLEQ
jgi:adenylyl-sulfate kinase